MVPDILLIAEKTELYQHVADILCEYDVDFCLPFEALSVCIHQPVRVVLIVQDKPGTSGLDLFAHLREDRPGLLGFLIVDKAAAADLCLAAMDYGFSGMFFPPLTPDHVQEKVSRAMESASQYGDYERCGGRINRLTGRCSSLSPYEHFINLTTKRDVLEKLLNILGDQTAADILSLMLYDEEQGVLRIAASQGLPDEITGSVQIKPGDRIAGRVFQKRIPMILNKETQNDSGFAYLLNRPEIVSAVSFPMIVSDKNLGVLNISYTDCDVRFADSDIEILGILTTAAALTLEHIDTFESRLQALLKERSKEDRG